MITCLTFVQTEHQKEWGMTATGGELYLSKVIDSEYYNICREAHKII
jgi:hypothetical protein